MGFNFAALDKNVQKSYIEFVKAIEYYKKASLDNNIAKFNLKVEIVRNIERGK